MIITKSYKCFMGTRRDAFHRAFRFFLENTKGVTQGKISKKTGIAQGMISGMKTGKRFGTEDSRYAVADFFGKTYEEFIAVGDALLEAEANATKSASRPSLNGQAQASNITSIDQQYWKVVDLFKQKDTALQINQELVEIEALDLTELKSILRDLRAKKLVIKEEQEAERQKRESGRDQGK